jgi:hypothetical protein
MFRMRIRYLLSRVERPVIEQLSVQITLSITLKSVGFRV